MGPEVHQEFSRYVDWEGDLTWISIPTDRRTLSCFGMEGYWIDALSGQATIRERVVRLWSGLTQLMPRALAVYADKVYGLSVLRSRESGISLVYFFDTSDGLTARRGYAPAKDLPTVAARFPVDLGPLYRVHNGLVNFMSYDGGPLPGRKWEILVDRATGEPSLVKVAVDGSEAFGFDISESPCQGYVVRPEDNEVESVADVWAFIDDLVSSRIEDL